MVNSNPTKKTMKTSTTTIANTASWYCAIVVVALIMLSCSFEVLEKEQDYYSLITTADDDDTVSLGGNHQLFMSNPRRPCDEIYVVGEGETLHTISDKCGDPFIVEKNPHIHDPDDVFPGLVIKITPSLL